MTGAYDLPAEASSTSFLQKHLSSEIVLTFSYSLPPSGDSPYLRGRAKLLSCSGGALIIPYCNAILKGGKVQLFNANRVNRGWTKQIDSVLQGYFEVIFIRK